MDAKRKKTRNVAKSTCHDRQRTQAGEPPCVSKRWTRRGSFRLLYASLVSPDQPRHFQPPTGMSSFTTVARVGEIPEGQGITRTVNDKLVAVFLVDGEYFAIDDLCPHMGASLGAGYVEQHVVTCPWHAWRFDVRTGEWCDNRKLKIGAHEVRVVGDEVQVRLAPPQQ